MIRENNPTEALLRELSRYGHVTRWPGTRPEWGSWQKDPEADKKTALKAKREALIMKKNPIEEILGLLEEHGADALPWDPDSPMVRLAWELAEEEAADEK